MRIISFDVGKRYIGVAVSDPTNLIATGLEVIENDDKLIEKIKDILKKYNPEKIIIGDPIHMSGSKKHSDDFITPFVKKIKQITNAEIILWDERLTSVQADKILLKGDVKRKKRKQLIDKVAASLILQSYLDYLNHRGKNV